MRELLRAGGRDVTRYTGTLLSVFVVQSIVATAALLGMAIALALGFAHLPLWDDAVDGDLASLLVCIRYGQAHLLACGGIALAALLLWQLVSWFVVGGVYGVLVQRPAGRAETARCFGAAGSATYLRYARLALCSLPGLFAVVFLLDTGLGLAWPRLARALTMIDVIGPLCLAMLPGLIVLHVLWTVSDYARVELALRHESHDPGVLVTYLRTVLYVVRRPLTLVHGALGWLAFAVITLAYAYFAQGHPMFGAEGAVTLFVIRQGVALARTAIRFAVLAGQVELGQTRALPPRRVEVTAEPKAG